MATTYSDVGALQNNPTFDNRADIDPNQFNANVCYADCLVTIASGAAAADIVRLFWMNSGVRIIPELSQVISNGMGTGATMTVDVGDLDAAGVGTAVDENRYADALDVAAAGTDIFSGGVASLTPYDLATESGQWITMTFATLDTVTTGSTMRVKIAYTIVN